MSRRRLEIAVEPVTSAEQMEEFLGAYVVGWGIPEAAHVVVLLIHPQFAVWEGERHCRFFGRPMAKDLTAMGAAGSGIDGFPPRGR
jgi:hypothetical protein